MRNGGDSMESISKNWHLYLERGHKGFVSENDDKSMILAYLEKND